MFTVTHFELNLQGQMGAGWVQETGVGHGGGGSVSGSRGGFRAGSRHIDGLLGCTEKLSLQVDIRKH